MVMVVQNIMGENGSFMKIHLPDKMQTAKGETIIIDKKGTRKSYYLKSKVSMNDNPSS